MARVSYYFTGAVQYNGVQLYHRSIEAIDPANDASFMQNSMDACVTSGAARIRLGGDPTAEDGSDITVIPVPDVPLTDEPFDDPYTTTLFSNNAII